MATCDFFLVGKKWKTWFETDSEMFPWMNLFAMKKVHNSNGARDFDAKKDVEVFLSYTPVD